MKSVGALKHFLLAFLIAVICYGVLYQVIETRRARKGPWEVKFTYNPKGAPTVVIDQHNLAITNVAIIFSDEPAPTTNALTTLVFEQPQPVPYGVPFGKCVFMDTTFLPGTVTFDLFGHEIELLPRVLMIDHQERQWLSDRAITLYPIRQAPVTTNGH
ncbi:MAG TPA: hypothetical protein VN578_02860 [Candidatus Binatia bacterium]|jgi:hypothetical protein|nr:hypothetical protein [Candidatus Binatia bacterium]